MTEAQDNTRERLVRIGKIVGFHGLRGEVKVRGTSEAPDWPDVLKQVRLLLGGKRLDAEIAKARRADRMVYLTFQGYPDRTSIEPWLGAELWAQEDALPKPEAGEYWVDDLIGLSVLDLQTGLKRGIIKDLLTSGGSDFLEIQLEEAGETVVIPFTEQFFPEIDTAARVIKIDMLSDFLDDLAKPSRDLVQ